MKRMPESQVPILVKSINSAFWVRVLYAGKLIKTIPIARMAAIKIRSIDSPINPSDQRVFLRAPTTFRIPTSLFLRSLRFVLRFIKLMQAMRRIKAAMMPNNLTNSIRAASILHTIGKAGVQTPFIHGIEEHFPFICLCFFIVFLFEGPHL